MHEKGCIYRYFSFLHITALQSHLLIAGYPDENKTLRRIEHVSAARIVTLKLSIATCHHHYH